MITKITILSPSLVFQKAYLSFISCIWTTQYYDTGDFELVVEYNAENLSALAIGNYVVKNNTNEVAVIEKVRYDYSPDEGGKITASGRMAISLLDRRLIYQWSNNKPSIITYCQDGQRVEEACIDTVQSQIVNPSAGGTSRTIPFLVCSAYTGLTKTGSKHVSTAKNLYEALTSLLGRYAMAHRIVYDSAINKLVYEVYSGTDKSRDLIFSRKFQNLLSLSYEEDSEHLKTIVYIGGDGEGIDRFVTGTSINGGGSQLNRREVFYGASSNRAQGEASADYARILQNEAKTAASEYAQTKTIGAEIDLVNSGYKFGIDYNVGDTILISDIVDFKPRITTIIESQSADGYTIDVEFNEDAPEEENE